MANRFNAFSSFADLSSPYGEETDPYAMLRRAFRPSVQNAAMENPPDDTGQSSVTSNVSGNDDYFNLMKSFGRPGPASEAYTKYLSSSPDYADYKPGFMNRLTAALAGVSAGWQNPAAGVPAAMAVRDAPYKQAVSDWTRKGLGLQAQAEMEDKSRTATGNLLKSLTDAGYKGKELELKLKELGLKEKEADATIGWRKAQAADLERKGWQSTVDAQGNTIMFKMNPDGSVQKQNLGPSIEKTKTDISRQQANAATTSAGAAVTNAQANTSRANTYGQIPGIMKENAETQRLRANQSFAQPSQQLYAHMLAIRQAVNENPDWAGFVDDKGEIKKSFMLSDIKKNKGYEPFNKRVLEIQKEIIKKNRMPLGPEFGGMGNIFDLDQQEQ